MMVAIHQPQYLPWLGYIDKIDRSDSFVILDSVQFKKNEWQNRNRIKSARGWQWLTVPVLHRHPEKIRDVRINNAVDWRRKHLQALEINYSRAPYFQDYIPFFRDLYGRTWERLAVLNQTVIQFLIEAFGINSRVVMASDTNAREEPTDRLIDICRTVGADTYLAGDGSRNYLDSARFEKEKIRVLFQSFHPPAYEQLYGPFEPGLSAVDLLFNCGSQSLSILRKGRGVS
jgi:WbqC-like protein family